MSDRVKQFSAVAAQAGAREASLQSGVVSPAVRAHIISVAAIALLFIGIFWRVFFLGETLIDLRTLDNQLPWGYYAAESTDYPYNRRDITDTYVTRDYFVAASYRDGELPLWNPYTMAGHPIYADGVTRIFSPSLLFYTFLDVPLGYSVARITELFLAAVFMYVFLVCVGAGRAGSLIGALVFTFSAHSMFHLSGSGWWGGLMWLPLILLCVDRAAARSSYAWAILAGVLLGAQFFCGWMQNQIYYLGAIVLYYFYFCFIKLRRGSNGPRMAVLRKTALLSAATLVTGFGLAATQWAPVMELLSHSNRRIVPTEIGYIYLPPWYLATLVFPNLFGSADDARALRLFTALNVSHDHILYMGIAALAPLAYCIYWLRRAASAGEGDERLRERAYLFITLAIVSLFIMMAAPLYVHVTRYIPVLQVIRVTVRAWVLFIFAASALAAFGTKLLLDSSSESIRPFAGLQKRFAILAAALVAVAVASSYLMRLAGIVYEEGGLGKLAYLRRAAGLLSEQFTPPRFDIVFPLLLLFMLTAALLRFASGGLGRNAFLAIFLALLGVDLVWISTQFNPTFDSSRIFPSTLITDRLRELPPGRVLVAPSDLETNRRVSSGSPDRKIIAPPNTLLPYQVPAIAGKNQQFPRWYRDYASLIEPQPYLSHVVFDRTDSPFFDLLNVKYILTHSGRVAPAGSQLLFSAEGVSLYENMSAMPRAFMATEVIEVKDQAEALETMRRTGFDPKRTVVIETGRSARSATSGQAGSATIVEDRRNRVVIECEGQSDAVLVVSDNYYPGWRAYVDGEPAEVLKANCTMRAVRVRAGRHVVSFEFAPATFRISVYATAATFALVTIALTGIWIGRKRHTPDRGI